MSYGRFILRGVKLPNFENVYHGPVVFQRLSLLMILHLMWDFAYKVETLKLHFQKKVLFEKFCLIAWFDHWAMQNIWVVVILHEILTNLR